MNCLPGRCCVLPRCCCTKDASSPGPFLEAISSSTIEYIPSVSTDPWPEICKYWVGLMLTFMLSALFFGLFVYFGECETDRVLVTSTLALDGPVSNCAPTYLLHNEKVVLDRHGRWEGEAGHQGSEGLWLVDFDGYKNSGEGLKKNVADLLTLAHSALDELDNLQYFEIMEALMYANITVSACDEDSTGGCTGTARIRPSFELAYVMGPPISDWAQARDMSEWIDRELTIEERIAAMEARWSTTDCTGYTYWHGYNHLRFNGVHAVSLFDRDEEIAGQEVHDGDCVAINGLTLQTTPFLNDIVAFVLRTNFYTLEWDADQVFILDYCNRNRFRDKCMEDLGTNNEIEATTLFSTFGSSERFLSAYSAGLDKFGFMWNTAGNGKGLFFVVPELYADFECIDCGDDAALFDTVGCQAFLAVELHYYQNDVYHTTFEYNIRLDGSLASNGAFATFHCDPDALRFKLTSDEMLETMQLPFEADTDLLTCDVKICNTVLERLADAFANTGLFLAIVANVTIPIVMLLTIGWWRRSKPTEVHGPSRHRSFQLSDTDERHSTAPTM